MIPYRNSCLYETSNNTVFANPPSNVGAEVSFAFAITPYAIYSWKLPEPGSLNKPKNWFLA